MPPDYVRVSPDISLPTPRSFLAVSFSAAVVAAAAVAAGCVGVE